MCVCQLKWHRRSIRKQMNKVNSLSHVSLTLVNHSVDIFVFTKFNIYICFANIKRIQRIKTLSDDIIYTGRILFELLSATLFWCGWHRVLMFFFIISIYAYFIGDAIEIILYLRGNHNIVYIIYERNYWF